MILTQLPAEFQAAKPIIETIEAAGYEAYFVGGCVRDTILGSPYMTSILRPARFRLRSNNYLNGRLIRESSTER